MNGCRINHVANTITLTKKFLHAASNPASDECAYLQQIRTNFPNLRVTTTPATKKKTSSRPRLSYKQMRNYINCLPDGEKWIEPFEQVMQLAKSQKNIMEFTQCVEEAVTEIQLYYDSILLKQNEIIEELTRRVDRLEKTVAIQKSPFEADIIATKDSLQKLKKAIMGIFR